MPGPVADVRTRDRSGPRIRIFPMPRPLDTLSDEAPFFFALPGIPHPDRTETGRRQVVVGLAGGVASGKSEAARLLAGADGAVIDADEVVREVQRDPEVIARMEQVLGVPLRAADGSLDRAKAAEAAFADADARRALEGLLHPEVSKRMDARLSAHAASFARTGAPPIVVLDVPLLFEAGIADRCDRIVFVDSKESDRLARASARGWDAAEVLRRETHQLELREKRKRSQHVLANTGSREDLAAAAAKLREELLQTKV
jgi:dephospho-CoA kinase